MHEKKIERGNLIAILWHVLFLLTNKNLDKTKALFDYVSKLL